MATARLAGMAGGSPAQGAASPQIPPASAAAVLGGPSVASITPPPFSAPQGSAFAGFISPPPPQRAAIEDRSELTGSLAHNGRPLIGGPSNGTAAMLPEPNSGLPHGTTQPTLPHNTTQLVLPYVNYGNKDRASKGNAKNREAGYVPEVDYEVLGSD